MCQFCTNGIITDQTDAEGATFAIVTPGGGSVANQTLVTLAVEGISGTKIQAAKVSVAAGTHMVITSGKTPNPLATLSKGGAPPGFSLMRRPSPPASAGLPALWSPGDR